MKISRPHPIHILDVTPHEIVVLKPAGLPCELPRDPAADSLVRRLEAQGYTGLRLVHRLDSPTCGVMLVARSAEAATYYSEEIASRRWHKWYVAQVGLPNHQAIRLIGPHRSYLKVAGASAKVVRSGGKPSFLEVTLTTPVPNRSKESHVMIKLHTGRFHQIRVMLADRGAPLIGDLRYGGTDGSPMYLEHVILATRRFESHKWCVFVAPNHPDRMPWDPELAAAITDQETNLWQSSEG